MSKESLTGKSIVIVDDEVDVLSTLQSMLPMCNVSLASSYDKAIYLINNKAFELAIIDIMGVNGYKLLDVCKRLNVVAVILTAHALTIEDLQKSYNRGAASYIPKEKMHYIDIYLRDILEAKEKGRSLWWRWLYRLGDYFEKKFGVEWKKGMPYFDNNTKT